MAEEKQENTKDTDINNTQPEKNPSTDTQTPKDDRNVYLMFIATDNDYIIDKHIVAQGWSAHDMTFLFRKENKGNIDNELNTYCENIKVDNETNFKTVFKCLLSEIKPKDIIIAKYRLKFYICEIPKNYTFYYNKNLSNEYRQGLYPVNWIPCPEEIKEGIGEIKPNFYIKHYNDTNDKIKKLWDTNKKNYNNKVHDKETDEILSSEPKRKNESFKLYINGINMKIIEEKADLLQNVKNLVLTGAPGTGKTHLARQIAEKIVGQNNTDEYIRTVQFHPSYDYTDFVEGLRPCYVKAKNDKQDQDSKQEIGFELKKGTFLDFCEKAAIDKQQNKNKANKYVFIIDEINRGEISKIFGEIFAAIEPGYRGNTKQKFQTQYANMHNYSNGFENSPFKDGFYVPDNLYIIGTMNDIDRSVESFDFALRRRFTWTEITAESQAIVMWTANELLSRGFDLGKLQNRMNNLNKKIEEIPGLSKDYHIGPAYFSKLKDYHTNEAYDKLWKNHLEPLLKEYLRGMENIDTNIGILKEAYNNEN